MVTAIFLNDETKVLFTRAKGIILSKNPHIKKTSNNNILKEILERFIKNANN